VLAATGPKGRKVTAKGEALESEGPSVQALKGRNRPASGSDRERRNALRPSYTKSVKSRRWIWIAAVALCAFAAAIGYLARPVDELAGVMRLHPKVRLVPGSLFHDVVEAEYDFDAPTSAVLASLPGSKSKSSPVEFGNYKPAGNAYEVRLPSGTRVLLGDYSAVDLTGRPKCVMFAPVDRRPWYQRAWSTLKSRLGF